MSGIITSGNFAKALYPGVSTWFGNAYKAFPEEWSQIFKKETSRRAFEENVSSSGFGLVPAISEGAPVTFDSAQQGFVTRFTHIEYGMGIVITRNMVDDDLYDVIGKKYSEALAYSARQTIEIICANVLNRGFNASYKGGDGKELLATDHPNITGGTYSNELSTPADLSELALEQSIIDLGKWKNDRGLRIAVQPQKLVIPVDLLFTAERILGSNLRVGTSNNDINALRSLGCLSGGYVVNHYLTDTNAWFLLTDVPNGLTLMERRPMEFTMDNDWDTSNAKYKVTFRMSVGWSDPKAIYGSAGA